MPNLSDFSDLIRCIQEYAQLEARAENCVPGPTDTELQDAYETIQATLEEVIDAEKVRWQNQMDSEIQAYIDEAEALSQVEE